MATKDYLAIAKAKIRKPGESKRMPRVLVYSRNKKGKTRFCTTAPNVLILDPEDGTQQEVKANPDVWPMTTWDDINELYHFLKTGKHEYRWVALDGLTRIANIALRWVMSQEEERNLDRKPNQVDKRDYGRAGEMVKSVLHNFHSLSNVGVIITSQERMIEVEYLDDIDDDEATPASYMFVPDLPKGARSSVNQIVDIIGRLYVVRGEFKKKFREAASGKVVTKTETSQRRLWVGMHDQYETGYRSQFVLPNYLPDPTIPRLITAMREGKS